MKIGPAITPETLRAFAAALRKKLRNSAGTFARNKFARSRSGWKA